MQAHFFALWTLLVFAAKRKLDEIGPDAAEFESKARQPRIDYSLPLPAGYANFGAIVSTPGERNYSGISNPRNVTCYMASVIQVIFHLKPLRAAILAMPVNPQDTPLIYGLQLVLRQLQTKLDGKPICIENTLIPLFRAHAPAYADTEGMDDAHQLFSMLTTLFTGTAHAHLTGTTLRTDISAEGELLSRTLVSDTCVTLNVIDLRQAQPSINSIQQWILQGETTSLTNYVITEKEVDTPEQKAILQSYMSRRGLHYVNGKLSIAGNPLKRMSLQSAGRLLSFFLPRYEMVANQVDPLFRYDYHFLYEPTLLVAGQTYELQAVVCFIHKHYYTYTRSANHLDRWLLLNNGMVLVVSKLEVLSQLGNAYLVFYTRAGWLQTNAPEPPLPVMAQPAVAPVNAPRMSRGSPNTVHDLEDDPTREAAKEASALSLAVQNQRAKLNGDIARIEAIMVNRDKLLPETLAKSEKLLQMLRSKREALVAKQ